MYLFSTDRSSITFELEGIHPPSPDLPNQKIYHEGMRFTVRLSAFKAGATGQINRILKLIRSEWPEAHPSWPRSSAQPVPSPPLFTSPFARPSSPMMESLRSSWGYDCQTVNLLLPPPSRKILNYSSASPVRVGEPSLNLWRTVYWSHSLITRYHIIVQRGWIINFVNFVDCYCRDTFELFWSFDG